MDPNNDSTQNAFHPAQNPSEHHHGQASSAPVQSLDNSQDSLRPTPVVKVLSPVGVEYVFLTFTLFVAATALVGALLTLVNGKADFSVLAFPTATLVVTVPLFAVLFLRLKRLELENPELRLDASKRRSTQFTQIVAFIVSLLTLIGFVFSIFAKLGGIDDMSIGKAALNALCVLVVSGGILTYYWRDEHRNRR